MKDEYDEFATDFLSVCCERAKTYYQEMDNITYVINFL